ncbi:hypothetical protein T484DRAFT_1813873 [Baffinella frigidus]|nr:hypothetical protein T484DRAFT_1813873 [Cryptophyta sp. CCMP2293]
MVATLTWHVVPELSEGLRNQTVISKALAGKAMILKAQRFTGTAAGILERIRNAFNWSAQRYTGAAAGILERIRNAFNWSDPNVSLVVWSWVCFLGATSSVLLYLSEGLWAIVSPRQIAACVMLMQFLPPRIRKALDVMENPLLRGVILDVTAAVGIEDRLLKDVILDGTAAVGIEGVILDVRAAVVIEMAESIEDEDDFVKLVQESMEDEDDFVKLDLLPGDFMGSDHHSDSDAPQSGGDKAMLGVALSAWGGRRQAVMGVAGRSAVLGVAGRAVRAGARMLYQIPDEMTMVHRTIANRQVCAAPRQPVASTRHSVASANVLNDDLAGIDVRPAKEKEHGWSSRVHKSAVGGRGMKLGAAGGRASTADTLEAEVEAELEELRTAPVSIEEAMKLSVSELKMRLKAAGVVSEGFMEKKEFAEALMIHSSSSASPRTGGAGGGYSSAPAQRGANSSASQERGSNSAPARGGGYSSMAAQGAVGGGAGGEGAEEKLALLEEMGLSDAEENRRLLGVYHGDVDDVVRHLLNRV